MKISSAFKGILGCVLFGVLTAFTSLPSAAQSSYVLQGTVRHAETDEGLAGVNVHLDELARGSISGPNGYFDIANVPPGTYTLVATHIGFVTVRQPISVGDGTPARIEVMLSPQPIELDEVLAQADRSYSAGSSRVIRDVDFRVRPTRSAQDLLQLTPGLITAQHAGGGKAEQIFLRGFDADHGTDVNISVDGIPVNMVSHGHGQGYADLHFVIPEVVQRIDVSKGPYDPAFGNFATAGSVAFTTRDHLQHNLVRVEGGMFNTASLTALYRIPSAGPHQGAYLAGQVYQSDGPFDSGQEFKRFNLFGKFHAHLSEEARLAASVSGFSSVWDASGQIPLRAVENNMIGRFGSIDDLEGGTTGRQNVNVTYDLVSGASQFQLQGYASRYNFKLFSNFTFFLDDPELGDMIEQTDDRQMLGLNGKYRFNHELGAGLGTTTLGGGFRSDDVDVTLWKSPNRVRLQPLVDSGIAERNLYLWTQEDLVFSPQIRLQLGLRWDYFTYNVDDRLEGEPAELPHASGYAQQSIVSPKASLVVSPLERLDFFANVGIGFHSNDARDIVISQRIADLVQTYRRQGLTEAEIDARLVTQNLDPEQRSVETLPRAIGGEIGFRTNITRRLNVALAGWLLDLDREFVYIGDGGFTELSGRSRRYGVDLEARLALSSWLFADSDLNLAHGTLRDEPDEANAIPLAPRTTSTGGLTVLHPKGYEGSLRYVYVGDRPANEDGSITADGYTLINLLATYRRGPLEFNVVLENLLDVEWNEAQFATESRLPGEAAPVSELHFTPGNPRSVRVGVAFLF